ncbi:tRNA glutamyl-Q(34) synthetase GluQRS [Flaviflexus salsibiostraticola]|uniref:tRNA glutamyl-Q(34) synthetase GluQRS n=1 Tax=Flaviflexus salsibiostraticola TaxID=1282737 RepID=A0A3S8Z9Z0_9ACTO|nr:tRNA glutamyl-Q(34) synthetase GluQRS [Flaviflexus salsibiostraticola]AZN30166.1 tRNA glutamyl-Q(34) synthetase GluQRS [Flaviflexus salsibiostraticola]
MTDAAGRYAPSPSGDLHLGNLRTALIAWACARRAGLGFVMRVEDLDERCRLEYVDSQLSDLAAIGIDWDGDVLFQSERTAAYAEVVDRLLEKDLLYECYCTRADIRDAPRAPHAPPGAYPGTCRDLSASEREAGREKLAPLDRGPALRLRTSGEALTITDRVCGEYTGYIDDFVVRRGDGAYAYNLVAVVDDEHQMVRQVVRADDLLESTPRQVYLQRLLGFESPDYIHVPLVLNTNGQRLAKRDGAVTLGQLHELGWQTAQIFSLISRSLGIESDNGVDFLEQLELDRISREPWVFDPDNPEF